MDEIIKEYQKPSAYKYGLKITSPLVADFSRAVEGGGEVLYVAPNTHKTLLNDLSRSRLILVTVEEGGSFEYEEKSAGEISAKSDLYVFLKGERAEVKITARYDLSGKSKIDILHKIFHQADNTTSNIETRGILRDESHAIYRSGVLMEKGLKNLDGNEKADFILLSELAKIDAIPALDIASREVKSGHALSIRRITEEELFYPRSRGFSEEAGKELILAGFLQ